MVNEIGVAGGVVAALFAGILHWSAHTWAGDESAFENAGVMEAGVTVVLGGFIIGYFATTGDLEALVRWLLDVIGGVA